MSRVIMSRSQVIMSSSRALCCLPSVQKQKHEFFFFWSMYNKTIIRFGFWDIQNNQGLGKMFQKTHPTIVYYGVRRL